MIYSNYQRNHVIIPGRDMQFGYNTAISNNFHHYAITVGKRVAFYRLSVILSE